MNYLARQATASRRSVLVLLLVFAVSILATWPAAASTADAPAKARLSVKGMVCTDCEKTVESVLNHVGGVSAADADRKTRTALVTFDPTRATPKQMTRAINSETYYRASVLSTKRSPRTSAGSATRSGSDSGSSYLPLALAAGALAVILVVLAVRRRRHGARSRGLAAPEGS